MVYCSCRNNYPNMFESAWNKQLRFYFIEENDDNCCDRVHGKLHINKNADCVGPTQPNFGQSCRTKIPESCLKVHETRFHFYRRKCWFLWDRMVKIAHLFRTRVTTDVWLAASRRDEKLRKSTCSRRASSVLSKQQRMTFCSAEKFWFAAGKCGHGVNVCVWPCSWHDMPHPPGSARKSNFYINTNYNYNVCTIHYDKNFDERNASIIWVELGHSLG